MASAGRVEDEGVGIGEGERLKEVGFPFRVISDDVGDLSGDLGNEGTARRRGGGGEGGLAGGEMTGNGPAGAKKHG